MLAVLHVRVSVCNCSAGRDQVLVFHAWSACSVKVSFVEPFGAEISETTIIIITIIITIIIISSSSSSSSSNDDNTSFSPCRQSTR